ncbi:vWA domain-containing protein [Microbulbifer sp. 2201CG32-9]|uniref:hypothetical protein n=1 Tax=Microbulbifer sp. 2201CG32-9 TaxID=3232309 RepID=UPI00345BD970
MKRLKLISTIAVGLLFSFIGAFSLAQTFHATVLIDRSGSMTTQTMRNGVVSSRCADALLEADQKVQNIFLPGTQVSVWTYQNSTYSNVTGGFVSKAAALSAINSLGGQSCTGTTPMADTVCDAIDTLKLAAPATYRTLWVLTDGVENSSSGSCSGGSDADGIEPWDATSWQGKIWQQLFPSDTPPYQAAGAGAPEVPIYFGVFGDYIGGRVASRSMDLAGDTPAVSSHTQLVAASSGSGFFDMVAATSGGYVTEIDDQSSLPTSSRFDVDGTGCVDQNDLIKMLPYLDSTVPPAPASLDVNGDLVVDIDDYNLVVANTGLGCGGISK